MTGENTLVEGLLAPEAYPWHPEAVEVIETHVSWVFLAGDRVVKVKRPVSYSFVDHTTLESRRRSCEEEVRLNRRLTEGVYLGVVAIVGEGGGYRVDEEGEPIEWATLMRCLPHERMLDALVEEAIPPRLGDRLAGCLIPFHRDKASLCAGSAEGLAASEREIVTQNLTEIEPFAGEVLGARQLGLVAQSLRGFVGGGEDLLLQRAQQGWVREGHGDLRAEHVCFESDGRIQIFDCLEFSRDLRCTDIASDLAFLLMDLDRLGLQEADTVLINRYKEAGLELPEALVRFYKAHRALVRAKVCCLKRTGPDEVKARDTLAVEAGDYLDLATAASLTVQPALIAMTGLSATGKSTVAARLGRALEAPVFSSDTVRKELADHPGPSPAEWGQDLYSPQRTEATYERLGELAAQTLTAGQATILDATFLDGGKRQRVAEVARASGVPFVLIETVASEEIALHRIHNRAESGQSRSDATAEVYRRQLEESRASPPPVPSGTIHVRVETEATSPGELDPVLAALHREGIVAAQVPGM